MSIFKELFWVILHICDITIVFSDRLKRERERDAYMYRYQDSVFTSNKMHFISCTEIVKKDSTPNMGDINSKCIHDLYLISSFI
jgi:hypothetical protein